MNKKNLLVAQSGSPSASINATLCGVIEQAMSESCIDTIYGVKNGIMGLLSEKFITLTDILSTPEQRELLCQTPSSILGSCRMKLSDWQENSFEYERIISILRKYNIGYFVYIGGRGSMHTAHRLSDYCKTHDITDISIIGVPKSIENDLSETHHSPGFGSAAKYVATTVSEIACDCHVYALPSITLVEIMGQDAGWLTASSALARLQGEHAPDLIYVPERTFSIERFLDDVREKMTEKKDIVIALCEGLRVEDGQYLIDSLQTHAEDIFGQKILAGVARCLEELLRQEIGCKVRSVELNLMQRCASHVASMTDIQQAHHMGRAAVAFATEGGTGEMVCFKDEKEIGFVPLELVSEHIKYIPQEWISESGNDISQELIDYILPLIQGELQHTYQNGMPVHFQLLK